MPLDTPSVLLQRHGLRAKKSWGQCFLSDPSVVRHIADTAQLDLSETVVEIGAGLGTLTYELAQRAGQVIAVERDRDMVQVLQKELATCGNVQIHEANALTLELAQLNAQQGKKQQGKKLSVVGNLPYNISSPLVFRLLAQRALVRDLTLMLQLELAQRLAAEPGNKTYGAPSVLCQHVAEIQLCFTVSRAAFVPRPQVDSAVIRVVPRQRPQVDVPEQQLRRVVRAAFGQRRKTLRRALASGFDKPAVTAALDQVGIDGQRRAESLSVAEFGHLALALRAESESCLSESESCPPESGFR